MNSIGTHAPYPVLQVLSSLGVIIHLCVSRTKCNSNNALAKPLLYQKKRNGILARKVPWGPNRNMIRVRDCAVIQQVSPNQPSMSSCVLRDRGEMLPPPLTNSCPKLQLESHQTSEIATSWQDIQDPEESV